MALRIARESIDPGYVVDYEYLFNNKDRSASTSMVLSGYGLEQPEININTSTGIVTYTFKIPQNVGGSLFITPNEDGTNNDDGYTWANSSGEAIGFRVDPNEPSCDDQSEGTGYIYYYTAYYKIPSNLNRGYVRSEIDICNNSKEYKIIAGGSSISLTDYFVPYVLVKGEGYSYLSNTTAYVGVRAMQTGGRPLGKIAEDHNVGLNVTTRAVYLKNGQEASMSSTVSSNAGMSDSVYAYGYDGHEKNGNKTKYVGDETSYNTSGYTASTKINCVTSIQGDSIVNHEEYNGILYLIDNVCAETDYVYFSQYGID